MATNCGLAVSHCAMQKRADLGAIDEAALTVFLAAIGGISAFIFALSKRLERRRAGWGPDSRPIVSSGVEGGLFSSSDSWSFAERFEPLSHGGDHGGSCSIWDGGGSGDSGAWGGSDCGGIGDGGGGGGGDGGINI